MGDGMKKKKQIKKLRNLLSGTRVIVHMLAVDPGASENQRKCAEKLLKKIDHLLP